MVIKKIKLINFRNYDNLDLSFHPNYNIFIGENGSGKTNILESIYFASLTKSFRTRKDYKMIKENTTKSEIKVKLEKKELLVKFDDKTKKTYINKDECTRFSDYIREMKTISFFPDTINLIKGTPSDRRKYLNIQISQLDKNYLKNLNDYQKILKQRNNYLKQGVKDEVYFEILTDKLIEKAIYIYIERQNYINRINLYVDKYYKKYIKQDNMLLKYINNIQIYDEKAIKRQLKTKFQKNHIKEKKYKFTLYGPHRDDFLILLNNRNITTYGSQGKLRISLLSLKFSEMEIYRSIKKENPIVILDDVFSELDRKNRKKTLEILGNKTQVIITTTEVNSRSIKKGYIYKIKNGKIVKFKEVK